MMKSVLTIIACCALGGCAMSRQKPVQPPPIYVTPICQNAPKQTPMTMLPTKFSVISDKDGVYWIALDPSNYEHLARNASAVNLALKEARIIIAWYADCASAANANDTRRNGSTSSAAPSDSERK